MTSLRVTVQSLIENIVREREFTVVKADGTSHLPTTDPEEKVKPVSVLCNEIDATFVVDRRYGREERLAPRTFDIEVRMTFDREVTLVDDMWDLLKKPIHLRATDDSPGCGVYLTKVTATHPVRQQANQGSSGTAIVQVRFRN